MCKHEKNSGWLLAEAVVAMAVLTIFFMMMVSAAATFRHFNRLLLARRQCLSAARAQLDSITATGTPMDDETIDRLWPGLTVSADMRPGEGEWQGLTHCVVTAAAPARKHDIEIRLCRYYLPAWEPNDAQP